jgi:hypothetical protein
MIALGLALATVAVLAPSKPASAALPPFYCERDSSLVFCVEFDGVSIRAGAGAPREVTWPFTRARVEVVYYDWEQNHRRVNGLDAQGRVLATSGFTNIIRAGQTLSTPAVVSWLPGVYCAREYEQWPDGSGRWDDFACVSTNGHPA